MTALSLMQRTDEIKIKKVGGREMALVPVKTWQDIEDYFEDSKTVGAEDHVCTMEKAGVAPSLDQIELWASALQTLNKGKVRMGREVSLNLFSKKYDITKPPSMTKQDMQSIREVLECISEAKDDFDPSMLEVQSQLSDSVGRY